MFASIFLAAVRILFLVGGLSAQIREGDIFWRPAGANYVQGPWAVQWQGGVYLGGHAGFCCFAPAPYGPGWEAPFVIEYGPGRVTAQERVLALPPDTHEMGWGTMIRVNGWWLYSGFRTTWTSWITMQRTGVGDRARGMLAVTGDPLQSPYPYVWWDVVPPYDLRCVERNTCGDWTALGPFMPAMIIIHDQIVLFEHDDMGLAIWTLAIHDADPYKAPAFMRRAVVPDFPWSDIAYADGKLWALVSGGEDCWWWDCREVSEHISEDGGLTWTKGERSWSLGGQYIGDACYVRDEFGHIKRDALTVIALVTPSSDPASGTWHFHYWVDPGVELPVTFGMPPGTRKVRQHLYHQFIPRRALRP